MTYLKRLTTLRKRARLTPWHTHLAWLLRLEQQAHIKDILK